MQIAIALYPGFTVLDAIGPYQVFAELADAETIVCAARRGRLDDEDRQLHFDIDRTFDEVPQPDVLVVPGGCTPSLIPEAYQSLIDWVRAAHEHTTYTTSVCTGSLLLGAAGLLDGLAATTHWRAHERLRDYGARPTEQRVVFQDKVVTGAGVSAGIDLALAVVARLSGPETAQAVQLQIEYDPQPPFDTGAPTKAPPAIRTVADDLGARTDGGRRVTLWPNGRRYDTATTR
jgi:transcriptional regulator GlxA family with amidase domain